MWTPERPRCPRGFIPTTGRIKTLGRVDRRDTFLDNHELERQRGITIFSKQAIVETFNVH